MVESVKLILSLSLSGTLLILLLFLCRPLYRNKLSKRWQYYIWLVAILRLLIPLTTETSLVGGLFQQTEERFLSYSSSLYQETADVSHSTAAPDDQNTPELSPINDTGRSDTGKDSLLPSSAGHIASVLFTLWLTIALLLFVRKVTIYQSFVKYIDAGSSPVEEIDLLEAFGHMIEQHRIKRTVDLHHNSLVSSPLLIGFFRPRIVLPCTDLTEADFYYTIMHELTHYRRLDIFYKWLVQLTICLHWFNPFVHLMGLEIDRLCELSCDERVIMTLPENARKSYGDTLLHAVARGGSYKDTLASITLNESKERLKGRLDALMHYKKLSKLAQFTAVLVTGILIGGAVVLGAYAAPDAHLPDDSFFPDAQPVSDGPALTPTMFTWPDYRVQYEDDIYYIFMGDATEADKPLSTVTNGYHKLVFVRKDGYTTFGSFRDKDMANLARHVESQCRTMLANGQITQEEKDFYLMAAEEIQDAWQSSEGQSDTAYPYERDGFDDWDDFAEWDSFDDWDDFEKWDAHLTGKDLLEEYSQNGIVTVKDDYYYQNARIRILLDMRPDGSFENFDYNDQGTVDLRLVRSQDNRISRVEYLSAEEAAEIMDDLYDTLSGTADEAITPRISDISGSSAPTVMDLTRVTRAEVSDKVRSALDACKDGQWYVIESDDGQYIYYNGLPRSYAYEPKINGSEKGDLITVDIVDIGTDSPLLRSLKSAGNYVLLAFSFHPSAPDTNYELAIRYNRIPVTYTRSQAK